MFIFWYFLNISKIFVAKSQETWESRRFWSFPYKFPKFRKKSAKCLIVESWTRIAKQKQKELETEIKDLEKVINFIRSYSSVPICIDTEGAQIRTRTNKQINLKTFQELEIYFNYEKNKNELNFYPYYVHNQLKVGDIIYIDFNSVVVEVTQIMKSSIKVFVINGGNVQKNKGVAVNKKLNLDPLMLKPLALIFYLLRHPYFFEHYHH